MKSEILEFYSKAVKDEKLAKKLQELLRNTVGSDAKEIISEVLLPYSKKLGYNFSEDDFLETLTKKLSPEDLEQVSGGFPVGLGSWILSTFASIVGFGATADVPSPPPQPVVIAQQQEQNGQGEDLDNDESNSSSDNESSEYNYILEEEVIQQETKENLEENNDEIDNDSSDETPIVNNQDNDSSNNITIEQNEIVEDEETKINAPNKQISKNNQYNKYMASAIEKAAGDLKSRGIDVSSLFNSVEKTTVDNLLKYDTGILFSIYASLNNIIYMFNQVLSQLNDPNNQLDNNIKSQIYNYMSQNFGNKELDKEEFLNKLSDVISVLQAEKRLSGLGINVSCFFNLGEEITVENLMNYGTERLSNIIRDLNTTYDLYKVHENLLRHQNATLILKTVKKLKSSIGIDVSYLFKSGKEITVEKLMNYDTEKLSNIKTRLKNIKTMYNQFQSALRNLNKDKRKLFRSATSKVLKDKSVNKEKFLHTLLDAIDEGKNVFDAISIFQALNELNKFHINVSYLFKFGEKITLKNLLKYDETKLAKIYTRLKNIIDMRGQVMSKLKDPKNQLIVEQKNSVVKYISKNCKDKKLNKEEFLKKLLDAINVFDAISILQSLNERTKFFINVIYLFNDNEDITLENLMKYDTETLSNIKTSLNNIIEMYNQVLSKLNDPKNQLSVEQKNQIDSYMLQNLDNTELNKEECLKTLLDAIDEGKNVFDAISILQALNELNKFHINVSYLFKSGEKITLGNLMKYDTERLSNIKNDLYNMYNVYTIEEWLQ